jgi:glyoxylase-like metal-dependent hydrolase (beta-lactamase superfamily II)
LAGFEWRRTLADGLPDAEVVRDALSARRAPLTYPFEEVPGAGEAIEVAEGVLWLRMPLPFALDHINLWALKDGDGWTLVDTGVRSKATMEAWEQVFSGPLEGRPVRRVVVTHMHPDHIGLAGWLTRRFDCRLWMTRLEYVTCRMLVADTGREAPEEGVRYYRAAGWTEAEIEAYRTRFGGFGHAVHHLPDAYRRIEDGETFAVDGRAWRVVTGCGHSPEHACLYREDDGLLISGDQVLPKISSNVSVWPTEPDADPLTDWLESIAKLRGVFPEETFVLPSHGAPFRGLHLRLDALARGHERSLERLLNLLDEPKRAVDVFGSLFARSIGADLLGMATGESRAHLNCLAGRGLARVEADAEGVLWWRAAQ